MTYQGFCQGPTSAASRVRAQVTATSSCSWDIEFMASSTSVCVRSKSPSTTRTGSEPSAAKTQDAHQHILLKSIPPVWRFAARLHVSLARHDDDPLGIVLDRPEPGFDVTPALLIPGELAPQKSLHMRGEQPVRDDRIVPPGTRAWTKPRPPSRMARIW